MAAPQGGQPPVNAAVNGFGLGNNNGGINRASAGMALQAATSSAAATAPARFRFADRFDRLHRRARLVEETAPAKRISHPTGVWVDAKGNLKVDSGARGGSELASIRNRGRSPSPAGRTTRREGAAEADVAPPESSSMRAASARKPSPMRFISLPRLEAAIAQRQANHLPLDPAMLTLGGLHQVQYVLVYPETGDLVLAGPAGDWQILRGGGIISAETHRPIAARRPARPVGRQRTEICRVWLFDRAPPRSIGAQQFLADSAARP
jgi:hypothetical protein